MPDFPDAPTLRAAKAEMERRESIAEEARRSFNAASAKLALACTAYAAALAEAKGIKIGDRLEQTRYNRAQTYEVTRFGSSYGIPVMFGRLVKQDGTLVGGEFEIGPL